MSEIADWLAPFAERLGSLLPAAAEPLADPPVLAATAALLLVLALAGAGVAVRRLRQGPRRPESRSLPRVRTSQVRALAARGASVLEIARSTGLPQDAIVLVLGAAGGRPNLPPAARIAATAAAAGAAAPQAEAA